MEVVRKDLKNHLLTGLNTNFVFLLIKALVLVSSDAKHRLHSFNANYRYRYDSAFINLYPDLALFFDADPDPAFSSTGNHGTGSFFLVKF